VLLRMSALDQQRTKHPDAEASPSSSRKIHVSERFRRLCSAIGWSQAKTLTREIPLGCDGSLLAFSYPNGCADELPAG
jgi:hypothetical protein